MKGVVLFVLFLAIVIVSWAVFIRQQRTQTRAAPEQATASMESRPATSAGR